MRTTTEPAKPPGPSGMPVIGNALESRRALDFLVENRHRYGDVVYYDFLTEPIYQLNHPDDIESVLVTNNEQFTKSHLTKAVLGSVAGDGLFTSDGDLWREQRRRIQPAFHPAQIAVYSDLMVDAIDRRLATWTPGERRNLGEEMRKLTLDIVARALLGVDIESEIEDLGWSLDAVLGRLGSVWYHLLPEWAPTPGNRRFSRALTELESLVDDIIDERRATPDGDDVVSRLLAAELTDDEPMDPDQLRAEVMTFLFAGHETTAQALTFTCYLLATHPDVEAKLVEELERELAGDRPSLATMGNLTYTEQVITEALRLYPPANDIHREPVDDVEIQGYHIPPGATVSTPPWVVHRDPRWYDDPEAFRPERWTAEFRDSLPRLAYFPFGAGPRRCVGERFALMELTLVLACLYQNFHLELDPETRFAVETAVTTRPKHPVWMTVEAR
ncbi:cytochrome P450 [Haloarchaeobius sp. HME9146]|uniref:cytochrome P450 n=1 Tax=Haloarchaeobius sp. HME9146 TaxID=2978732 RepID=UPI0021C1EA4B|nr:cytochrome P450 [Haloarchaeobius sp. HME9146]MCT9095716.1 cytochrome P450 [Haloarchaeobius sp. HME9146]